MLYKRKWKIHQTAGDRTFDIMVNSLAILATIITVYPIYFVFMASLSDPSAINSGEVLLFPVNPRLTAYERIIRDSRIWTGYTNTIFFTIGSVILGTVLTVLGGYALSRKDLLGRNFFMKLLVFTMYFNGGLIPTYMVIKGLGLINTSFVLILLGSFSCYNLIITRTFFLSKIPDEILEAARIDGCGNGRSFFSIVLPLSKEIVSVLVLFFAVNQWNSYFNALIYLNNQKLYPLQLVLREILIASQMIMSDGVSSEELVQMQRLAETIKYGVIIVASVPLLLIYPFLQKFFIKGVMVGSIKG